MGKTGVAVMTLLIVSIFVFSDAVFVVDETSQVLITQFGE